MRHVRLVMVAGALLVGLLWFGVDWTNRSHRRAITDEQRTDAVPETDVPSLSGFAGFVNTTAPSRWRDLRQPPPAVTLLPIEGKVVDGRGAGIGHVTVKIEAEKAPPRWSEYGTTALSTDADGGFRFPRVPEGIYSVVAVVGTWEQFLTYTRPGVATGTDDVRIEIPHRPAPLPIFIRVKALHPSGRLLKEASMRIWGFAGGAKGSIKDGYGEICLWLRPPPGRTHARLSIDPPEGTTDVVVTDTRIDLRIRDHEIWLDAPQVLTGQVLAKGEPCAVEVHAAGWAWTRGEHTVQSGSDGCFRFENLPKGEVGLTIGGKNFGMLGPLVVPTDARGVVVNVLRAVRVTGAILPPPGKRLGEVKLHLWARDAPGDMGYSGDWEDVGSTFDLGPRVPGSWCELRVWGTLSDGALFVPRIVPFKSSQQPLAIRVKVSREVRGRVVRTDGSPVVAVKVSTEHEKAQRWNQHQPEYGDSAKTDEHGAFSLTGIDDDGWYVVAAKKGLVQVGPPLLVRGGEDLRIVLAPPSTIRGRVVDEQGKSLYGITIGHWHSGPIAPRWGWLPGRPVGGDGVFSLANLAPGRHMLYVWSNDWNNSYPGDDRYALATVEAGAKNVQLALRKGETVEGQVTSADGTPLSVQVRIEGRWGIRRMWTSKGFRFLGIPPGPCIVQARQGFEVAAKVISKAVHTEAGGPPLTLVMRKPR